MFTVIAATAIIAGGSILTGITIGASGSSPSAWTAPLPEPPVSVTTVVTGTRYLWWRGMGRRRQCRHW